MTTLNRTSYAILGLLARGPKSGYEIKQVVEKTIRHFWKESYGHIYPMLNRLMADGMVVRVTKEQGRTSARSRYAITSDGRLALEAWLVAPLEPEGTRNELALRLYFGQYAPVAASRTLLQSHHTYHCELLARYKADLPELEAQAATGDTAAVYELITLSLGIYISEARIAWCNDALQRLDELEQQRFNTGV